MPRLSVIVPVHNREKYLPRCMASILSQSMGDFEVFLVDDGSSDGSGVLCDKYAAQDVRVQVLHQANKGQGAARNAALELAKGDYIAFADSDDWLEQGLFATALSHCQNQNLDVLYFETTIVREGSRRPCRHFAGDRVFSGAEALQCILQDEIDSSCWNKLYQRHLWQQVRFTEGRLYEDVATVYRVLAQARRVGYIEKSFYNYQKHADSSVANAFNVKSRYDHFLGYKERCDYAQQYCPTALDKCRVLAVKKALGVLTAAAAGQGSLSPRQDAELLDFIRQQGAVATLNAKHRLLAWGACHCRFINMLYGRISLLGKKLSVLL